jgi:hypothetical protein
VNAVPRGQDEARYWSLIEERYGALERLEAERQRPVPPPLPTFHATPRGVSTTPRGVTAAKPKRAKPRPKTPEDAAVTALRRAGDLYRAKNATREAGN